MSLLLKHYSCWRTTVAFSHTVEILSLAPVEEDMDLFGKTYWPLQSSANFQLAWTSCNILESTPDNLF